MFGFRDGDCQELRPARPSGDREELLLALVRSLKLHGLGSDAKTRKVVRAGL